MNSISTNIIKNIRLEDLVRNLVLKIPKFYLSSVCNRISAGIILSNCRGGGKCSERRIDCTFLLQISANVTEQT